MHEGVTGGEGTAVPVVAAHLVCRVCRQCQDVVTGMGDWPCPTAADAHGFVVEGVEISFDGHCPRCRDGTTPRRNS